ncbi:hypothetical protein DH2020_040239 [Rehmannia glutinosa]|uniref:Uncharacterized protein n=1 Tax=Rehmannia glutinosa TaxID=99300 RepID=A0ABR0UV62_REHGL
MDESTDSPAEVNSIACLNKKRKSQNEPLEMPLPKHVCWSRRLGLNQIEIDKFAREVESDPDSAKDSNSFQCNLDSTMSTDDETKTDFGYFVRRASNEPSTSSTSCAGTSSQIDLYPLESRSLTRRGPVDQDLIAPIVSMCCKIRLRVMRGVSWNLIAAVQNTEMMTWRIAGIMSLRICYTRMG